MSEASEVVGRFYAAEADNMNAGGAGADFAAMAATLDRAGVLHVPLPAQAALDEAARGQLPTRAQRAEPA